MRKLMMIGMLAGSVLSVKAETKPHVTLPKLDIAKADTTLAMVQKTNKHDITVSAEKDAAFPETKKHINRNKNSLYIVMGSRHTEGTLSHAETIKKFGYNEKNPGLLYRHAFGQRPHSEWGILGGALDNSIRDKFSPFLMAGRDWFMMNNHLQVGIYGGAAGYGTMVKRRVMDEKTGINKIEAHSEGPMKPKYLAFLHAQVNITKDIGFTMQGLAIPGKGSLVTYGLAIGSGIFKKHNISSTTGRGLQPGYYSQTKDEILKDKLPNNPVKSIMYNNADSIMTNNAYHASRLSFTF
jgi:hypothetical protein